MDGVLYCYCSVCGYIVVHHTSIHFINMQVVLLYIQYIITAFQLEYFVIIIMNSVSLCTEHAILLLP